MNTTNINNASTVTDVGLNWFAAQEEAWNNFHYISISYVMPVNCAIGLVENLAILGVLYRLKTGIGETSRVYYALIAAFNILELLTLHLLNAWSTAGLKFATQSKFYFRGTDENLWICKVYKNLYVPFAVVVMWTYVLLNIERVFAIASPLTAKSTFTLKRNLTYVSIVGLVGIPLWVYFMSIQEINAVPMVIGPILCLAQSSSLANIIFYEFISNVAIFTLPPALSLILGLLLFFYIRRQQISRSHLISSTSRSADTPSSAAIAGGIVVIIMAIVHSIINLPAGLLGCFFFMCVFYCF